MKNSFLIFLFFFTASFACDAQMCPGGGTDFTHVVTFDPSWIYGCNTGTSCNGGVYFDNRVACEPTTVIDACAPAPPCTGSAPTGSDIWFAFYPTQTSVTLVSFQNTSLIHSIQAFSGGTTCGSLVTIGCAVAAGPSSGLSLSLTGLTVGQKYYFRIFGAANSVSQRTGLYCFCGTTGVDATVLSSVLSLFSADNKTDYDNIHWQLEPGHTILFVEVQRSFNGRDFYTTNRIRINTDQYRYDYAESANVNHDTAYYRLKLIGENNSVHYSKRIIIKYNSTHPIRMLSNVPGKPLVIETASDNTLYLFNYSGICLKSWKLAKGIHAVSPADIPDGIYFLKDSQSSEVHKVLLRN